MTQAPPHQLMARAEGLLHAGRIGEATQAYEQLLSSHPEHADGWYNLGWLHATARNFDAALAAYQRAIDAGVAAAEEAHLNRAALMADHLARPEDAEAELGKALALNPRFVPGLINLGNLKEQQGESARAATAYEHALSLEPGHALALSRLPNVRPLSGPGDELIERIRAALGGAGLGAAERADLGFALGKSLDAVGAYDEAFAAYAQANRASRESHGPHAPRYEPELFERYVDRLIEAFPEPVPATGDADLAQARAPIFICGMFRSGSTLVETILGSHPAVTAGGEIDLLPVLAQSEALPLRQPFAARDAESIGRWRKTYLDGVAARYPAAGIITDKRPDNFLYIGLIKALFPRARIVHTRRNAIDTCLSIYFLHLGPAMAYASDLLDIAHWHGQHERLMAHWKALYPSDIHEVIYDDLVAEPRPAVERLLRFCGLPWDEACLRHHETKPLVRTPSNWQVRKPLYAQSSGRWRHYERHLGPLLAAIGPR